MDSPVPVSVSFDAQMDDRMRAVGASYDRVALEYADRFVHELEHKPLDRALLQCFAELVSGGGMVADVGCGPGHVTRHLRGLGLPAIGVDLSPAIAGLAARLTPEADFVCASMLTLPFADSAWAGAVALYSVIHVPPAGRPAVFREMCRVLRPSGVLLLSFHIGDETLHLDEWWDRPVDLDFHLMRTDDVVAELTGAGLVVDAVLERSPYEPQEHPTRRGYVLAHRP
jgi:SAM-dependent methyltransferase